MKPLPLSCWTLPSCGFLVAALREWLTLTGEQHSFSSFCWNSLPHGPQIISALERLLFLLLAFPGAGNQERCSSQWGKPRSVVIRGAASQEQEHKSFPPELDPHMENLPKVSSASPGQAGLRLSGFHSLLNETKAALGLKSSSPSRSLPCTSIPLITQSFFVAEPTELLTNSQ